MNPLELAYCAGVIDSDGTIGIKRNTYNMRKIGESKAPTFSERICVKQVEPHAVSLLHRLFGGSLYRGREGSKSGRPLYVWQVTDVQAWTCLRTLLPYLRIKNAQAANCLALRELKVESRHARGSRGPGLPGRRSRPVELTARMENLYANAKALNAVGLR